MGLKQFLKGSSDPKDMMPGCANYDHHYGGCLLDQECLVEQGKRCGYFERAVLPTASQLKAGYRIIDEYQKLCLAGALLSIRKTKAHFCQCGNSIPAGRRYCDKCKKEKRKVTKHQYQRKFRLSQRSTVDENRPL